MDRTSVLDRVDELDVNFVRLQFTDILGVVKNVSIPVEKLEDAFEKGVWFDGSSIEGFVRIQESDMRLIPDPETFAVIPWADNGSTARLICDVERQSGERFAGDPRHVLRRAVDRAGEMGYTAYAGPEPEFFVFDRAEGEPTTVPHDTGGYFDLAPRDMAEEIRRRIVRGLRDMEFEVEASHHEVADGQHEINFAYEDAMTTADNIATFRSVVRAIAERRDLHATFMPKPIEDVNGSGMHTHISLFDSEGNAFYDADDRYNLSPTARQFVAGVLAHAPALTAVCNPTVNSYKRLIPGYEAPVYVAWSAVNRSALIRVPQAHDEESTRVELRSPDPSCNPYLALAAIIRAGLDGIEKEMTPPDAVEENIYEFDAAARNGHGIDTLPATLGQALDALEDDAVIRDALGEHVVDKFLEAKRAEWKEYTAAVTGWEEERYLEAF